MSFDKEYVRRKDWRKPYWDSRAIDATCRSNGSCPWCARSRRHKVKKHGDERSVGDLFEDERKSL